MDIEVGVFNLIKTTNYFLLFSSNFVGSNQSFLFKLRPKMRIYSASNYNNYYQYLNVNHQQTMPNGLGLGGEFNNWGLWIDDNESGTGECHETCTTYKNYAQLSATRKFKIKNIEVWGVGDKPFIEEAENQDSILSVSSMERAVLNASGKEFKTDEQI